MPLPSSPSGPRGPVDLAQPVGRRAVGVPVPRGSVELTRRSWFDSPTELSWRSSAHQSFSLSGGSSARSSGASRGTRLPRRHHRLCSPSHANDWAHLSIPGSRLTGTEPRVRRAAHRCPSGPSSARRCSDHATSVHRRQMGACLLRCRAMEMGRSTGGRRATSGPARRPCPYGMFGRMTVRR